MPLFYAPQNFGSFGLSMGLTPRLLRERFGLDYGERFHKDILYRIETLMEMDRSVWDSFREIGLGYREPFPRATIEPFGHRFVPVLYGSPCLYSAGEEPVAVLRRLDPQELRELPPWTAESLKATEAVREVIAQYRAARQRYGDLAAFAERMGYNPHYQPLSCQQNLGSVINTAVSVFGQEALLFYVDDPQLLKAFYRHITDLMLLCLGLFSEEEGRRPAELFVGNCTVAMISPQHYEECNLACDRKLSEYACSIGARFLVHQDSDVTPHLENYARLGYVQDLDFGQDTDFRKAAELFPGYRANCILFPSWIASTSAEAMREELLRIMKAARGFSRFSFSIFEVDPALAEGKIFEFYEIFRRCCQSSTVGGDA
jgi:hypothetical protein